MEPERTDSGMVRETSEEYCESCANLKNLAHMAKQVIKQQKDDNQELRLKVAELQNDLGLICKKLY